MYGQTIQEDVVIICHLTVESLTKVLKMLEWGILKPLLMQYP